VRGGLLSYREGVSSHDRVPIRTTTDDHGGGLAVVVAGYGIDPGAAVRDLTRVARGAARELNGASPAGYEVVGVQLAAGEVPDNHRDARTDTRPGWCAYGTLQAAPAS
jgi:hypothetical protein